MFVTLVVEWMMMMVIDDDDDMTRVRWLKVKIKIPNSQCSISAAGLQTRRSFSRALLSISP